VKSFDKCSLMKVRPLRPRKYHSFFLIRTVSIMYKLNYEYSCRHIIIIIISKITVEQLLIVILSDHKFSNPGILIE